MMKIIRQINDRASPINVIILNRIAASGGADFGLRSYYNLCAWRRIIQLGYLQTDLTHAMQKHSLRSKHIRSPAVVQSVPVEYIHMILHR